MGRADANKLSFLKFILMSSRIRSCLYLLLQFICVHAYSQVVTSLRHYSTANGLSDNRITAVTKDKEGFMWFGSWAGISRFDGYNFLTFKSYPGDKSSLKSNRIDEVVEDSGGRYLWVKAYDKQVYRFDKRTHEFASLPDLLKDSSVAQLSFSKILNVKDNCVWLRTDGRGVMQITNCADEQPVFTIFSHEASSGYKIPSNDISFFTLDKFKNVWLGTSAGLCILKKHRQNQYKVETPAVLSGQFFPRITEGKNAMWLPAANGTLLSFSHASRQVKRYKVSSGVLNHILASKKSGNIYCTTSAGELLAVNDAGRTTLLTKISNGTLLYMFEDNEGVLWVESEHFGVIKFDPRNKTTEYLFPQGNYDLNSKVRNILIFEDKNSIVWMNLKGRLYYYSPEKKRVQSLSSEMESSNVPLPNDILRIFYDPAGVLWIGTGYDGIAKLVFQENDFKQFLPVPGSSSRADNEVRGILADRSNRLWFGTKAGQLYLYSNGRKVPDVLTNGFVNKAGIYSILQDRKDRLWFGTKDDGIIKADPADKQGNKYTVTQYFADKKAAGGITSNSIYCLLEDKKGRIWAGSFEDGLILIEEKDGKITFKTTKNCFKNYPKASFKKIRHMAEDAQGRIWIGTTNGLLIFDPDSGAPENYTFREYKKEPGNINSLGGNEVQFIFCDSQKQMWVLTTSGGLNLASGSDPLKALSFLNYSMKDGLPSDFLLGCVEDNQGNLWIASQNGLSRFSIRKRKFQNFNYSDGLHNASFSEASCTKLKSGEIFFGTTAGYLSFDPEKIRMQSVNAPMAFTNLQINSENIIPGDKSPLKYSINNTEEIELNYDQNVISIDFAVLDFHFTEKQNYACRLRGFDNTWRNTEGQRRATYTKLPPGNYVFEVKSLNDELYQNVPARSLKITILPPFWRTWWAYTIYLILACVAVVIIRRVAITMLKLRQGIEVERRLADLKLGFFTQISHELRTPLTLIINPSEEILKSKSLSGKEKEYMSVVVKNARRMLRLVNQVLDLRKVQSGKAVLQLSEVEILSFVRGMLDYFRETTSHRNLRVEISSDLEELYVWIDADKLEIVLYNLLANAIKFSPDNSTINITLVKDDTSKHLKIEVADEGSGVHEGELLDIFKLYYEGKQSSEKLVKGTGIGLALSKELVELHGGNIYAKHNSPNGLKVVVELLLGNVHFNSGSTTNNSFIPEELSSDFATDELTEFAENSQTVEAEDMPLVLLVEDNDDLRRFLATKFADHYRVETAVNGMDGLSKAKEILPDLVLSDVMMPELDGIQLLDRLKNDPATSHIPVILLTAKYSVESQIQALAYDADYYITKPFKMELLQVAVSNIIGKRKKVFQSIQNEEPVEDENQKEEIVITEYDRQFLEKILQIVEGKMNDLQFNIEDVADSIDMSRSAFYRKFKSLTDLTPVEFVRETRLKKAKSLFDAGEDNISVAAYAVGFSNPKYFSYCFRAQFQQSPSDYVKGIKSQRKKKL